MRSHLENLFHPKYPPSLSATPADLPFLFTPESISELPPNCFFVFGSNLAGRHGKGAALTALSFGAIYGIPDGFCGNTYAIPTKDENLRSLPLSSIYRAICRFNNLALAIGVTKQPIRFIVTRVGCGYAGYRDEQMAPMFIRSPNVIFPKVWEKLTREVHQDLVITEDCVYIRNSSKRQIPYK